MSQGPSLIFDKSSLESLNLDEVVLLDNFCMSTITPLFYVECLADLEKKISSTSTPEQLVGSLADRTPEAQSYSLTLSVNTDVEGGSPDIDAIRLPKPHLKYRLILFAHGGRISAISLKLELLDDGLDSQNIFSPTRPRLAPEAIIIWRHDPLALSWL